MHRVVAQARILRWLPSHAPLDVTLSGVSHRPYRDAANAPGIRKRASKPFGFALAGQRRRDFASCEIRKRARFRRNVVLHGLHPILQKLAIPKMNAGLHAFRHGFAAALVEAIAPISILQSQMSHSDVSTTLRLYTHAIQQSHRAAMEGIGLQSALTGNQHSVLRVTDSIIK